MNNNNIKKLCIIGCPQLIRLYVKNCNLVYIYDLYKLNKLIDLDISHNNLKYIEIDNP